MKHFERFCQERARDEKMKTLASHEVYLEYIDFVQTDEVDCAEEAIHESDKDWFFQQWRDHQRSRFESLLSWPRPALASTVSIRSYR